MTDSKWILASFNNGKNKSIHFYVEDCNRYSCNLEDAKLFDNEESINKFKRENIWAEFYTPYKVVNHD